MANGVMSAAELAKESAATGGGFFDFLRDPNIQVLASQIGAGLDPQGAGGILGRAGINLAKSRQAQKLFGREAAPEGATAGEVLGTTASPTRLSMPTGLTFFLILHFFSST